MAPPSPTWLDDDRLVIDGVEFVSRTTGRFASERGRFSLIKPRELTEAYLDLLARERPRRIVELGVFQGGSAALAALVTDPEAFVAVDIATERVAALDDLIAERGLSDRVHVEYGVDQSDPLALRTALLRHGIDDGIDLVVDDASHLLGPTRRSFDTLFPLLRPGGLFVIEDWQWAHTGLGLHLPDEAPLTELVFELTMALPSRPGLIRDLHITREWVVVVRGDLEVNRDAFSISACYNDRGRDLLASSARR